MNNKTPTYLEWFKQTKSLGFKLLTITFLILPFINYILLLPTIEDYINKTIVFLIVFWSTCWVVYQPMQEYKKLLNIGWFDRNDYKTNKPLK